MREQLRGQVAGKPPRADPRPKPPKARTGQSPVLFCRTNFRWRLKSMNNDDIQELLRAVLKEELKPVHREISQIRTDLRNIDH